MTKVMRASALAVSLIKSLEGWSSKPYKDSGGLCTLGWGHLIADGEFCPAEITVEQGEKYLRDDIARAETIVNNTVDVPLLQREFDALVSFTFNIGATQWAKSDTLKILNQGHTHRVPARLMMWNKVTKNGVKVEEEGLINRRLREVDLWRGK